MWRPSGRGSSNFLPHQFLPVAPEIATSFCGKIYFVSALAPRQNRIQRTRCGVQAAGGRAISCLTNFYPSRRKLQRLFAEKYTLSPHLPRGKIAYKEPDVPSASHWSVARARHAAGLPAGGRLRLQHL